MNVNKTKLKGKIDEVDQTENIDNQNVIDKNVIMTTDSFYDTNASFDTENLDMSNSGLKSTSPDMLNILSLNCCGIIKKKLQYPEFETLLRSHDIICLVETKLDDRDEIKLPGYIFKFKNRKKIAKVKSGGILLGYKQKYEHFIEVIDTGSKFVFWFKISSKIMNTDTDTVFGIVYIPPEYTSYASWDAFSQIENEFLDLSSRYKFVSLVGDFNGRTTSEKDFLILDSHDPSNNFSDLIENSVSILDFLDIPRERKNRDIGKNRDYWKVLNQGKRKKQPDIPIEKLFDFFKDLNASPTDDNGADLPPLDEDQRGPSLLQKQPVSLRMLSVPSVALLKLKCLTPLSAVR
ncbi:Hypothetical predicted protein [Mytilus galloprovincialis]|uniref:Endonuclease/exonuclease/phosphatase domain-containing protein n=1 Tax=Mytilus galloprovincialis TaxID=29158 RepID=A0A8B6GMR5_MYTGA|nr:Hypothetical predicted protein [Mytilus galloprovincialis]